MDTIPDSIFRHIMYDVDVKVSTICDADVVVVASPPILSMCYLLYIS